MSAPPRWRILIRDPAIVLKNSKIILNDKYTFLHCRGFLVVVKSHPTPPPSQVFRAKGGWFYFSAGKILFPTYLLKPRVDGFVFFRGKKINKAYYTIKFTLNTWRKKSQISKLLDFLVRDTQSNDDQKTPDFIFLVKITVLWWSK